jgi:hypothetical protein
MKAYSISRFRAMLLLAVVGLVLLAPSVMVAQSCALCYTQAASSTQRFIQALRSGIIILMVPPAFLSVGITVICYQRRNQFCEPDFDSTGLDKDANS